MEAFSNHQYHHPFLLHSSPSVLSAFGEQPLINTTPTHQFPLIHETTSNLANHDASCADNQSCKMTLSDNEPSVAKAHTPETSMVVDKLENGEHVTRKEKKRRYCRNGSSLRFSPDKEATEGRNKKQKKRINGVAKEEENPKAEEKKEQKKIPEVPPTGYIHVRARRGQATDSHSLAERVRREKISERMKMLQGLVPGCDKVTGKALVLDQIINYVQSLQNQVEILSMRLASVNPMFCDFTMGLDTLMGRPERLNSLESPLPSLPQCSTNRAINFADDYLLDNSASVFLQGQGSNVFSSQDAGSHFWDADDQRQMSPNPCGVSNNLCSFQC